MPRFRTMLASFFCVLLLCIQAVAVTSVGEPKCGYQTKYQVGTNEPGASPLADDSALSKCSGGAWLAPNDRNATFTSSIDQQLHWPHSRLRIEKRPGYLERPPRS